VLEPLAICYRKYHKGSPMKLAVSWEQGAGLAQLAQQLAVELQLPLLPMGDMPDGGACSVRAPVGAASARSPGDPYDFLLVYDQHGLSLRQLGPTAPNPLRVSFDGGRELWRLRHGGGRSQLIARALGLHKMARRPDVLDATAGLGRDAFVLAGLGCHLTLLERSPIIAALLADGLLRLADSNDPQLGAVAERMSLYCADAVDYLRSAKPVDVIYLDPMFPEHGRSAGVKKEMQFFRALLPDSPSATQEGALLDAALQVAHHRVVVKRMKKSPIITGVTPSYQMVGKAVRYDIYALRKYE
jgi:16S rRNA (guanine1516-N2)-methyltransferase